MLHTLWGKSHGYPHYDKREWVFLQRQFEGLLLAAKGMAKEAQNILANDDPDGGKGKAAQALLDAIALAEKEFS